MTTARREYFLLIIGLILLIITGAGVYYMQRTPNRSRDMAEVSQLVTTFGTYEKNFSLLGTASTSESNIRGTYGQFLADSLIRQWVTDPATAPGRLTSSPWPDHIEVDSISPQGSGYIVNGRIVMMTSTGVSGYVPVVMLVLRESNAWKIAAYQESKQEEAKTASTSRK